DDWRLLRNVLGWPSPDRALDAQDQVTHRTITGAAETVVKTLVAENAITRLGLPVTCATDQARGDTITVDARFAPLADVLFPAVEQAGLGVVVYQEGAGLVVDVVAPGEHPRVLSEASGAVQSWSLAASSPGATRVVVG